MSAKQDIVSTKRLKSFYRLQKKSKLFKRLSHFQLQELDKLINKIEEFILSGKDLSKDKLEELKEFPELGSGLDRVVFDLKNDLVLKVAFRERSTHQNAREIRQFKIISRFDRKIRELFIPLLTWDKKNEIWIIVPKVLTKEALLNRSCSNKESDIICKKVIRSIKYLRRELRKVGLGMTDLHEANIGYYNKKPIIIDYGFPMYDREGDWP